jgi:multidrug efflux pump
MNLPKFSLTHKPVVFAVVIALFFLGIKTFMGISRREDPAMVIRNCVVITQWPGAPAEKIEDLLTSPLEKVIKEINEVKLIKSSSRTGTSVITVELVDSVLEVDQFWDEVRNKVNGVQLPKGCSRPFVNGDFGEVYVVVLNLYQVPVPGSDKIEHRYTPRELELMTEKLEDELKTLPAVGKTQLHGAQEEVIYVEVGSNNWAKIDLTSRQLAKLLDERNIVAPGGAVVTNDGSFTVRPSGDFQDVEAAGGVLVSLIDGHVPVRLADLDTLKIRRDYRDPPRDLVRFGSPGVDKAPSVALAIAMKDGFNVVELGLQISQKVEELKASSLPPDIEVSRVNDLPRQVAVAVRSFADNLWQGVLIVLFVAWLMMGWRPATVMATAVPITMIIALAMMPLFGVELERFSIASLIIALGMLVDNAIVISDNCLRLLNETGDRELAMTQGAQELAIPVLTSTLTTVGVFFPMYLLPGNLGEYVRSLPLMVGATLLLSYVIAMCVTPIMCTWILKPDPKAGDESAPEGPGETTKIAFAPAPQNKPDDGEAKDKAPAEAKDKADGDDGEAKDKAPAEAEPKADGDDGEAKDKAPAETEPKADGDDGEAKDKAPAEAVAAVPSDAKGSRKTLYHKLAAWCIDHRFITLGAAMLALALTFQLPVGNEFFPPGYRDQFFIKIWLPEGASVRDTSKVCARIEDILQKTSKDKEGTERMVNMVSFLGYGGPRLILTVSPEQHFPNHAYIVINTTAAEVTKPWVDELKPLMEEIPGIRIELKLADLGPAVNNPVELRISGPSREVLREIATAAVAIFQDTPGPLNPKQNWNNDGYQVEVKIDDDAANLAGVTNADIASALNELLSGGVLSTYREGDHNIKFMLRSRPADREDLQSLQGIFVNGRSGKVPLEAFATIVPTWQPAVIERRNELRTVTIGCQINDGFLPNDVQTVLKPKLATLMKERNLGPSYKLEDGGAMEKSIEAKANLGQAMMLGMIIVIMVLIIQYNSVLKPFVILATLPLALIGAIFGLYVTGWALGFMAMLGIVSLFGVVINNAIVLIDFIQQKVREGQPLREATVDSGYIRMKPIVLTTLTTVGGMFPLGLYGGPLFAPLAWAMIFGLGVSTVLTLIVVPTIFVMFVELFGMSVD